MRVRPVFAATIALTFIMAASSHAPPPSDTSIIPRIDYECLFPPANVDEFQDVTKEALALLGE